MTRHARTYAHPDWSDNPTAFILGGGPSLKDFDIQCLEHRKVIAVNEAGLSLCPCADVLYWADMRWINQFGNIDRLHLHTGLYRYTSQEWSLEEIPRARFIQTKVWRSDSNHAAFFTDPNVIGGFDGGGRCINLAYHFKVKRVVLLGFDMRDYDVTKEDEWRKGNFHTAHHKPPLANQRAERFIPAHDAMAAEIKRLGLDFEVLNATPGSALECWPKVNLEDVL